MEVKPFGPGEGVEHLLKNKKAVEDRKPYHCGLVSGSPVSNLTLGTVTCPVTMRIYRDEDDMEGQVSPGNLQYLSEREHKHALKKLDRLIVEWIGQNPPAKPGERRGRGIGPNEDYLSARVYDTDDANIDVNPAHCEPMTRYVYIYPVASDDQRYGEKPSIERMRSGDGRSTAQEELAHLEEMAARKRAEIEALMANSASSAESEPEDGKPIDPEAAALLKQRQRGKGR